MTAELRGDRDPQRPAVPRRILVRGVNWIGDAVMTIPAMRGLRSLFPGSRITLLFREPLRDLFAAFSAVDEVSGFAIRPGARGLADRWALARRLREGGYDLCLILPNSLDSALVPFLAGIPERIGFQRDGRGPLLTRPVPPPGTGGHQAGDYLSLVECLGPVGVSLEARLEVVPAAAARAEALLAPLRARAAGPLVAVHPGATYGPAKRWFPERFAETAARLCRERGAGIVITGGPGERELGRKVAAGISGEVLDLAGGTDLPQLAAVLSLCDLAITNDSGPMHLSAAVGTPVVAVFGSTEPGATSPLGPHRIVRKACECSPCLERTCKRGDLLCMQGVHVEDVLRAAEDLLTGEVRT